LATDVTPHTAVETADPRHTHQHIPADETVTAPKVPNGAHPVDNLAAINTGVVGNGAPVPGVPTTLTADDLAALLDQHLAADQIGVSTAGGAVGPSVQTAVQALVDQMVAALNPTWL